MISLNIGTIVVALVAVFMAGAITGTVLTEKEWRKICDATADFWESACKQAVEDNFKLRKELKEEKDNE